MVEERRRSSDKSLDRELGELTAAVRDMAQKLANHETEGAKFREYQRERNRDILNEINAISLSSQLMQQKLDESCAQLNDHARRIDNHHAILERHGRDHAKAKGALKVLGLIGLPGTGAAGAYFTKLFGGP